METVAERQRSNRVLKNYWGRSTSCLRERQAHYSRLICLLTCMNGTSWPDIVGVGRQFTGQFHKDPLYPQPAKGRSFSKFLYIIGGSGRRELSHRLNDRHILSPRGRFNIVFELPYFLTQLAHTHTDRTRGCLDDPVMAACLNF